MKVLAPAKINLALNVIKKNKDGYHDLDMINASINLYDKIYIKLIKEDKIIINCSDNSIKFESNLINLAIIEFKKIFPFSVGVKIKLKKRIPIGAGLGGGSSNAASVIIALNKLLKAKLSDEQLLAIALNVGSDVPYFLTKKWARVRGRGEKIKILESDLKFKLLLVVPPQRISTRECFLNLNYKSLIHPQIDQVEYLINKSMLQKLPFYIGNSLMMSAQKLQPVIDDIFIQLKNLQFSGVVMSGSGSSLVAFLPHKNSFKQAFKHFKNKGFFIKIVEIIN